ncbi:MAG: dihydroxyacetone kinase subunit DhaL [Eubacterium aggregans]|jgi:dihydroxyacetone kinase-like protein|uniref:phosphoenolpyruvate--glycerone phosphotransferase n=1 Tax=Eubacterium aggregans TaxID=81409 RepID=A0A1H4CVN0_9FIRM|nr:dihydroxyacetone kinase subunit DhaL [Eubacterium aggregans]MDD4691408.1 dihydroxyacetone kinase subunit DhaL [Eubacterium aggregans]MEA5074105.1 dihydroxyacetone kinase subunit DhaL [Eubacterium aggregans]SEA64418.1 dihydroxyacetone kinase DhaL subunit [Eubacterium aggregans]
MAATKKDVLTFVDLFNNKMEEHRQALTDMDQAIGDGDHGINMNRGMKAVEEKIDAVVDKPIADILKSVGMTLVSTVGGASGPLYGTAFMKAGMAMKGKEELSASDISEMFDAAIAGIISRGKATTGEKTMLDALVPAKDAYNAAIAEGKSITDALVDAEDAAWKGVEYTKTIIATKGRASYLGERSIGFQDPGATSVTYLIQAAREAAQQAGA